jgi:hypothetical protein
VFEYRPDAGMMIDKTAGIMLEYFPLNWIMGKRSSNKGKGERDGQRL